MKNDEGNMYNYFQALIRLFSEICLQRNYKGINPLKKSYPIGMVIDCTLNPKIKYPLRCEFAKLLLNLHLDVDPYQELAVPVKSRIWNEIGADRKKLPQSQVRVNPVLLKLKEFVQSFLISLKGI